MTRFPHNAPQHLRISFGVPQLCGSVRGAGSVQLGWRPARGSCPVAAIPALALTIDALSPNRSNGRHHQIPTDQGERTGVELHPLCFYHKRSQCARGSLI
jgi:hypothetical protein